MSLKAFHLVFIVATMLLTVGFGAWNLMNYFSGEGIQSDLYSGIGSAVALIGLIVYERSFLKKTRNMSYL